MKAKTLFRTAALGAAAYAGVSGLVFYEVFHRKATIPGKIFEKSHPPKENNAEQPVDARLEWMATQSFQEYTLQNADGKTLKAFYLPADTDSDRYVICAHGYRSRGKREFRYMTKYYHDKGFHVLLVDHRASGDSEGAFISFGIKESEDLLLWLDFVRNEMNPAAQIVLHGVSMGAATVLMLSDRQEILPHVKYIVSDCAFTRVTDQFRSVLEKSNIPFSALFAGVNAVNRLIAGYSLLDAQPIEHVKHACVPILFIHGAADDFVPTWMGQENFDACTSPKDLLLVDGAGHAESYPTDSAAYEAKLNEFMDKYLCQRTAERA